MCEGGILSCREQLLRVEQPEQLNEFGDDSRPSRLMAGAHLRWRQSKGYAILRLYPRRMRGHSIIQLAAEMASAILKQPETEQ